MAKLAAGTFAGVHAEESTRIIRGSDRIGELRSTPAVLVISRLPVAADIHHIGVRGIRCDREVNVALSAGVYAVLSTVLGCEWQIQRLPGRASVTRAKQPCQLP